MLCDWIICSPNATEVSSPVSPSAPSTPTDNNVLVHLSLTDDDEHLESMNVVEHTKESAKSKNDFLGAPALSPPMQATSAETVHNSTPSSCTATESQRFFMRARTHGLDLMSIGMNAAMGTGMDLTGGVHVHQPQGFGRDASAAHTPPSANSLSPAVLPAFKPSVSLLDALGRLSTPEPGVGHSSRRVRDAPEPLQALPNNAGTPSGMHIASSNASAESPLLFSFTHMLSESHLTPPTSSLASATSLTLTPGYGVSPVIHRGSQEDNGFQSQSQSTPPSKVQSAEPKITAHTVAQTPSPPVAPRTEPISPFPLLSPQPRRHPLAYPYPSRGKPHPLQNALSAHSADFPANSSAPVALLHPRPQLPSPFAQPRSQSYLQALPTVNGADSNASTPDSTARSTPNHSPTRPSSTFSNANVKTTRSNHSYGSLGPTNGKEGARERKSPPPPRRFFPLGSPLVVSHAYLTQNMQSSNGNAAPNLASGGPLSRIQSPAPPLTRQRSRTGTPAPSGSSTPTPYAVSIAALSKDLARGPLDDPFPAPYDDKENHANAGHGNSGIAGAGGAHPYRTRSKQKGASLRIAALVKERDDDLASIRKAIKLARGETMDSETDSGPSPVTEKDAMEVDNDADAEAETGPGVVEISAVITIPSTRSKSRTTKSGSKSKSATPAVSRTSTPVPAPPSRPIALRRSTGKRAREEGEEDENKEEVEVGPPTKRARPSSPLSELVDVPPVKPKTRSSPLKVTLTVSTRTTRSSARMAAKEVEAKEAVGEAEEAAVEAKEVKVVEAVEVERKEPEIEAEVENHAVEPPQAEILQAETEQAEAPEAMHVEADDAESDLSSLPPSSPPPEAPISTRPRRFKIATPKSSMSVSAINADIDESDLSDLVSSDLSELDDDESEFEDDDASADESKRPAPRSIAKAKAKSKAKSSTTNAIVTSSDACEETESIPADNARLSSPTDAAQNAEAFPLGVRSFNGEKVENVHADFPLLYRRFPVISHFEPGDERYPPAACPPPSTSGSTYNPPRFALDLYTPRFVKGIGRDKCGLCPICFEPKERGGEGKSEWLSMKFSAFNYHLQYVHGISPSSALPVSPPTALRFTKRKAIHKNEKTMLLEGLCHRCEEWAPMEGVKNIEAKLKEIYWWKHAAQCHKGSHIAGEGSVHLDDELGRKILQAYDAAHSDSEATSEKPVWRPGLTLAPRRAGSPSKSEAEADS